MRRRTLLGTLTVALLGGCGSRSVDGPETATEGRRGRTDEVTERWATAEGDGSDSGASKSVTVVNDASEDRYVTLVVERGTETVFVESRTVRGGTSVRFADVVRGDGPYRVVVDTASGVGGRFDWEATVPIDTLRVDVGTDVAFSQVVRCEPDCEGVSLGGTSTGYPDGAFDPRGRRVASTLRVRNGGRDARRIRLRIAEGAVLDYEYRVPSATVLVVPVPQRSGETPVAVDRVGEDEEAASRRYGWRMEQSPTLDVDVDSALAISCGPLTRSLSLRNDDDTDHTLDIAVTGPAGESQFSGTFEVAAGTSETVRDVVPTAGTYRVEAATATSTDVTEWSTCPPTGPLSVTVRADGSVVVSGLV